MATLLNHGLNPWAIAILLNSVLLGLAGLAPKKLLTPAGYLNAWLLGVLVWGCLGWRGYAVVMVYFLVGSGVTRIGQAQKEAAGIAENGLGRVALKMSGGQLWSVPSARWALGFCNGKQVARPQPG